jgi:uncharacterized protein YjbI with pentapeptide repeats
VFTLEQSAVGRNDFAPLRAALEAEEAIDARGLRLESPHVAQLRSMLGSGGTGQPNFDRWLFQGSSFGDGCDLSDCRFTSTSFEACSFGEGVSFARSIFGRGRFKETAFGDDANFERTRFQANADFHTARFGNRARFSYAFFNACKFFSAQFGEGAGFAGVRVESSCRFPYARFGPRGNFTGASFPELADFGGAYFGEKFQMMNASFAGSPTFVGSSFGARARMTGWHVQGTLNMRSTHFLGAMSLHGASVGEDASFEYTQFHGSVDLGEVCIGGTGSLYGCMIGAADRFGPLIAEVALDLRAVVVRSACVFELSARSIELSDVRLFAPSRITVFHGDLSMDRTATDSRLVLAAGDEGDEHGGRPRLTSVRGCDVQSMVVSGIDVRALRFDGIEGIDGMRLESGAAFAQAPAGPRAHREAIAEEHRMRARRGRGKGWYPAACRSGDDDGATVVPMAELARIYRGLRKAREDMRDAPGAADFYYGEMEMRRLDAAEKARRWEGPGSWSVDVGTLALLQLYRVVGGYGVRPSRPLLFFIGLVALGAACVTGFDLVSQVVPGGNGAATSLADLDVEAAVIFVLRSALLLSSGEALSLKAGGEWLQIAARVVGPVLVGLFVFGLRARLHR